MVPKQPPGLNIKAFCDADEYDQACLPARTPTNDWAPKPPAEDVEVLEDQALLRFVEQVADLTLAPIKKSSLFEPIPEELLRMILNLVAINNLRRPGPRRYGRKWRRTISHHIFKARIVCRQFAMIGGQIFENLVKREDSPYGHYRQLIISGRKSPLLIGHTFTASTINFRDLIDGMRIPLSLAFHEQTTLYEFLRVCEHHDGWGVGDTMPPEDQLRYATEYANMRATQAEQYQLRDLIVDSTYAQDLQRLLLKCKNELSLSVDWYSHPCTWQVLCNYNRFSELPHDFHSDILIFDRLLEIMPNTMTRLSIPSYARRIAEFREWRGLPLLRNLTSLTFELDPFMAEMTEWHALPSQCPTLDSLTISFENHEPEEGNFDYRQRLEPLILDMHWRHLRCVSFSGLVSSIEVLRTFVAAHRKTLRKFNLLNLELYGEGNWHDLLVALKAQHAKFDSCTIRTLEGDPEPFDGAFPNHVRRVREYSWEDGGRYLLDIGSYLLGDKES